MKLKIIKTADGSHTLYVPELSEYYHSIHGAIQESRHVFIREGFHQCKIDHINLLEIGYGTGLNALLTWIEAKKSGKKIRYLTIEPFPLNPSIIKNLNYPEKLGYSSGRIFRLLHEAPWEEEFEISRSFTLLKIRADIKNHDLPGAFDLVYYDAFGPDKQPEMWTDEIFRKIYNAMAKNAIFVTYSAKGEVRRTLQETGLDVSLVPGPPEKRHMLRGIKIKV